MNPTPILYKRGGRPVRAPRLYHTGEMLAGAPIAVMVREGGANEKVPAGLQRFMLIQEPETPDEAISEAKKYLQRARDVVRISVLRIRQWLPA